MDYLFRRRHRLALLVLCGLVLQASWILFWTTSGPVRIGDTDFSSAALPAGPLGGLIGFVEHASGLLPEIGPLPLLSLAASLGLSLALAGAAYVAGLVVLYRGAAARRGASGVVLGFALLFQLTMLLMPGVFSTDIFSYLVYGQLAGVYGLNPYIHAPSDLVGNPLVPYVYEGWRSLSSPYGPVWSSVSAALAPSLEPLAVEQQMVVHKLLMGAVHLVNLGLVWLLLGRGALTAASSAVRVSTFAIFAWNPLVLLEMTGNGHNDGLMLMLLLAGLIPLASRRVQWRNQRWVLSGALLAASALVKYATLPVALVAGIAWARELPTLRARLAWLGGASAVMLGIGVLAFRPWYAGLETVLPAFNEVNGTHAAHSVTAWLEHVLADALSANQPEATEASELTARFIVTTVAAAIAGGYILYELRSFFRRPIGNVPLQDVCASSARISLALLLLVKGEMHVWYLAWPLVLAMIADPRGPVCRLAIGLTVTMLPVDYMLLGNWGAEVPSWTRWMVEFGSLLLPCAVVGLPAVRELAPRVLRRWRGRNALPETVGWPAVDQDPGAGAPGQSRRALRRADPAVS